VAAIQSSLRWRELPWRAARWLLMSAGYLAIAYLLLAPVLQTYVIADDFEGPFAQTLHASSGLSGALSWAWHQSSSGDLTRIFGATVADVVNWGWLWLSRALDTSIQHVYSLLRMAVLIAAAVAAASYWWIVARSWLRPVRWFTALLLSSVALFGTVQLHALWSNDPVESFTLAGYGSAAVGLVLLTLTVWVVRAPSIGRFAAATALALVGVSYYELNVGAVIGGAIILAAAAWERRREFRALARYCLGIAVFCGVPAIWLLATRAASSADKYAGRTLHASGALHTFVIGLVSSLPGAAWHVENSVIPGSHAVSLGECLSAVVVMAAVAAWMLLAGRVGPAGTDPEGEPAGRPAQSRLMLVAAVAAAVVYGLFAIALEAATVMSQELEHGIGYVYTSYAVSSTVVALALAGGAWLLFARAGRGILLARAGVALVAIVFVAVQLSYNVRAKDAVNALYAHNQLLDNNFAARVPEASRCAALASWLTNVWPDYYQADVVIGTDRAYRYFYGQPFCSNWASPATNFSQPFSSAGLIQWWLLAPRGRIYVQAGTCPSGCTKVLHLVIDGFAVPHQVTLSYHGTRIASFRVSTALKSVSVPIHLRRGVTRLTISAAGPARTPHQVDGSPDMRELWVAVGALRLQAGTGSSSARR
jgi:hypothetical protein